MRVPIAVLGVAVWVAAAAAGEAPKRPEPRVLLPTAEEKAVAWRYTAEAPGPDWVTPDFDDASWREGPAGFGTAGTPGPVVGTAWNTPDVWLRTAFDYDGEAFEKAAVRIHHDEDAAVYVNGQEVLKAAWYITGYECVDATAALRKALRHGRNVIAVSCHQTSGGQYVDVGVVLDPKGEIQVPDTLPPLKPLFDYPLRDTSACVGGDGAYYLTGTTGHPTWWKTNEGIRVWKSVDLKTWQPLGLVWTIEKDGTWQKAFRGENRAIWAPEIHFMKGTFWLTYCVNYGGTGILRSTSGKAEGPYKDVRPEGPLTGEIDASLFQDDDGKVYFVYQNGKIARMKDDMTGLAEEPRLLKPANAPQVGFEGAFLTKIGGRYQLVCADFIKGDYHCLVASADKIDGPYGDRYIAVPHGGHNMFLRDTSGQWWATFFGNDPHAPFRERAAMLPIEMDPEGRLRPRVP
ncbi:MAG: family 43 glycosylhydrolase [Acidobacteria bacterium]|nr:family 43 glycosylhydrolase [Acidobacteriota bacterium]